MNCELSPQGALCAQPTGPDPPHRLRRAHGGVATARTCLGCVGVISHIHLAAHGSRWPMAHGPTTHPTTEGSYLTFATLRPTALGPSTAGSRSLRLQMAEREHRAPGGALVVGCHHPSPVPNWCGLGGCTAVQCARPAGHSSSPPLGPVGCGGDRGTPPCASHRAIATISRSSPASRHGWAAPEA